MNQREAKMTKEQAQQQEQENNVQQQNNAPEDQPEVYTKDQVQAMISQEVAGLKNKNNELLGKIKLNADKAKEAEFKKEQDYEGLKSWYEEQLVEVENKYKSDVEEARGAIRERDKTDVINQLSSEFVDGVVGSKLVEKLIDVEDGKKIFRDFDGNIVSDNVDGFKTWMRSNPHMAHIVKSVDSGGGGANGGAGKASESYTQADWDKLPSAKKMEVVKALSEQGKTLSSIISK